MPLTEYHTDEFITYTQTLREAKENSKHEESIPLSKVINDLDLK